MIPFALIKFQSTHPHGVRLAYSDTDNVPYYVSIHAPTRGATLRKGFENIHFTVVSIHAPTRGATRPRQLPVRLLYHVSIHAPTRGATHILLVAPIANRMFQSTHPHGVRLTFGTISLEPTGFNPRTLTGCDLGGVVIRQPHFQFQSTHPHGVRLRRSPASQMACRFQSTHPHGVRHDGRLRQSFGLKLFQSTHPHGVRPAASLPDIPRRPILGFNPRTHTGCDAIDDGETYRQLSVDVSIHAPTRGATVCKVTYYKSIN